ncbi:MAG: Nramp family divalent metal transporter [Nocardioidaceae bacterium]
MKRNRMASQPPSSEPGGADAQPTSLLQAIRSIGPGLVVALAWLGTGDLVDSSVSGSQHGYALMWVLVIALGARVLVTSSLAKYQLCNAVGDQTLMQGYRRIWRGLPLLIGGGGLALAVGINGAILSGAGTALYELTGRLGHPFFWAALSAGLAIVMTLSKRQYKILEVVARGFVVVILGMFTYAAVAAEPDVTEILSGLALGLPNDTSVIGAALLAASLVGAVGGSAANLLYGYLIQDKGWNQPHHRLAQRLDIWAGGLSIIAINLLIWIVAAETLGGTGESVASPEGLSHMMVLAVGPAGATMLWLSIFAITFDNLHAWAYGFAKMFVDALHLTSSSRQTRYVTLEGDPLMRRLEIGLLLVVPLILSLPKMPNMVVLTVVANAVNVVLIPVIAGGLIYLTTSRRLMRLEHANKWWETTLLLIVAIIGLWATYHVVMGLPSLVGQLY